MPLSKEEGFLRNTSILHFLPQNYLTLGVGGHEIYNFLSPYSTCYIPNLVKNLPSGFIEEDVNARRRATDANP